MIGHLWRERRAEKDCTTTYIVCTWVGEMRGEGEMVMRIAGKRAVLRYTVRSLWMGRTGGLLFSGVERCISFQNTSTPDATRGHT